MVRRKRNNRREDRSPSRFTDTLLIACPIVRFRTLGRAVATLKTPDQYREQARLLREQAARANATVGTALLQMAENCETLAQSATLLAQSKDNIAKRTPAKPASDA